MAGYATESFVTSQGYITSAALTPYLTKADNLASVASVSAARDNLGLGSLSSPTFAGVTVQGSGANVANLTPTSLSLTHATSGSFTIQPSVGITFPDMSVQTTAFTGIPAAYITSVSSPLSVSAGNLSINLSSYLTTSAAASTYYPLTNPSGYITSSALTGYATQAWVDAQGYLQAGALTGYATEAWVSSGFATTARGLPASGTVGQTLVKNSGTDYDVSWATFVPGDRYLSTSTTSLSVSNGTKTLTIGTGLSYTTQQDIVIAYDSTNHMHALVTSYDSGTGVLVADVQNHTGAGTYASWTVNVGGTTPLQTVEWGEILGVLGDQTDLATALNAKLETSTAATTYAALSGATFTGEVITPASTTSNAGLTITPGVAPSAPTDGEIWATTSDLQVRLNGVTETLADQSWVQAQGYLTDAPSDGNQYARKNGAWNVVSSTAPYITSVSSPLSVSAGNLTVDLSAYLTTATASATYQTIAGMSSYLTTSAASSTYVAKSGSSMTGGLTMGAGGYIGTFSMLSGNTITIPDGGAEIYETVIQNKGLLVRDASNVPLARFQADEVLIPSAGITFSDATTQTSAGITAAAAASTYQTIAGMSTYATNASPALTGNVTITTNSASPALVITQDGAGDIIQFKDVTSDTTYSFIDANGKVGTIASTTTNAGFNVPHGTAPTSPTNGDVWTTTSGLFYRINGATISPATLAGGTFTGPIITTASTTSAAGFRIPVGTAPTTPTVGDVWLATGATGTINFRAPAGTTQAVATLGLTQTFTGNNTFSGATLNFGNATTATTIGLGNGATATATTKTVNVATGGTSGSTTAVNIGTNVSGATSTITLNGTVTATGLVNGVKAWVNFNGTGTVAIRASSNVTSITDNGVADYTVNFTTAISDANYLVQSTSEWIIGNNGQWAGGLQLHPTVAPTTTAVRLQQTAIADFTYCHVVIIR
jgi:hypothetical protein